MAAEYSMNSLQCSLVFVFYLDEKLKIFFFAVTEKQKYDFYFLCRVLVSIDGMV